MPNRPPTLILSLFLLFLLTGHAESGIPCAAYSSVTVTTDGPACSDADLVCCPAGDLGGIVISATVLDCLLSPSDTCTIRLDYSFSGTAHAEVQPASVGICNSPGNAGTLLSPTNANGVVSFRLIPYGVGDLNLDWSLTAVCASPEVLLASDQVAFQTKSPDFNGNGVVNFFDTFKYLPQLNSGIGYTGNLNCLPPVNFFDTFQYLPHLSTGHSCQPVGACCRGNGICTEIPAALCNGPNDTFQGVGTQCSAFRPTITLQPLAPVLCRSGTIVMAVGATGTGTLSYTWRRDGVPVGVNSSTLSLLDLSVADNGAVITCDVTDDCGTTTTNPVLLTIVDVQITSKDPDLDYFCIGCDLDLEASVVPPGRPLVWSITADGTGAAALSSTTGLTTTMTVGGGGTRGTVTIQVRDEALPACNASLSVEAWDVPAGVAKIPVFGLFGLINYGEFSPDEISFMDSSFWSSAAASQISNSAREEADARFDATCTTRGLDGSPWNAFLHAVANCKMAKTAGVAQAKGLFDAHEEFATSSAGNQQCGQAVMDLHNNAIGRSLSGSPDCGDAVRAAMISGQLRWMDPPPGGAVPCPVGIVSSFAPGDPCIPKI